MNDLLFLNHPLPWAYQPDAAYCGNGSSIDYIVDDSGAVIATSYSNNSFDALWTLYNTLSVGQKTALGGVHYMVEGQYHSAEFKTSKGRQMLLGSFDQAHEWANEYVEEYPGEEVYIYRREKLDENPMTITKLETVTDTGSWYEDGGSDWQEQLRNI